MNANEIAIHEVKGHSVTVIINADRALSIALLAKHVTNWLVGVFALYTLNIFLEKLIKSTSHEKVNELTDDQAKELASRLGDVIQSLGRILDHGNLCLFRRKRVFKGLITTLENLAEDIRDIREDLILSSNAEFRALVADCVDSLSSAHAAGTIGRM